MTYDPSIDIALSVHEHRTVTLYPDSEAEQSAIGDALLEACERTCEVSGEGYSGSESRGYARYRGTVDGDEWTIDVVNAP